MSKEVWAESRSVHAEAMQKVEKYITNLNMNFVCTFTLKKRVCIYMCMCVCIYPMTPISNFQQFTVLPKTYVTMYILLKKSRFLCPLRKLSLHSE